MKAFRAVRKTMQGPGLKRFQQREPADLQSAKERLRAMADRLKSSGQNLADANSNPPPPKGEAEA